MNPRRRFVERARRVVPVLGSGPVPEGVGARLVVAALVLGITVALPAPAHAQDPPPADSAAEARQQYQDGTKAFSAKRYSEAALHFEAAASFKANAIALYTAALAWDFASRPERAADAYGRALEVSGLDAKQSNVAKDRLASLEKSLGTLLVTAPDGYRVQLDTWTEVASPARLHGSSGVHILSVRAPNRTIERRDVSLDAGRVTPLDVKDEPKAPKPEPEAPPAKEKVVFRSEPLPARLREPFWTTVKVVGVGIAGLGVAALGATAVLGTSANGAKDAYNAAPSREGYDHASSLQTWTNVSLVAGGLLVAGGVALVVVPLGERDSRRYGLGPRTLHVGALPTGAALGGSF